MQMYSTPPKTHKIKINNNDDSLLEDPAILKLLESKTKHENHLVGESISIINMTESSSHRNCVKNKLLEPTHLKKSPLFGMKTMRLVEIGPSSTRIPFFTKYKEMNQKSKFESPEAKNKINNKSRLIYKNQNTKRSLTPGYEPVSPLLYSSQKPRNMLIRQSKFNRALSQRQKSTPNLTIRKKLSTGTLRAKSQLEKIVQLKKKYIISDPFQVIKRESDFL